MTLALGFGHLGKGPSMAQEVQKVGLCSAQPIDKPRSRKLAETAQSPGIWVVILVTILVILAALSGRVEHRVDVLLPTGIVLLALLSFMTGANSVSEGVATLVASGESGYRSVLAWGSFWTLLGSLAGAWLAASLVHTVAADFIQPGAHFTEAFALAVMIGMIVWMLVATRIAMPVAATHALAGGLVIVGLVAFGPAEVRWVKVLLKVVLPIALSPLIAVTLAFVATMILSFALPRLSKRALSALHWMSSAAASFARGLSETPKIVGLGVLLLVVTAHGRSTPFWLFALVGGVMALGSFLAGKRVTRTLAEKVTDMDRGQAFSANVIMAGLVGEASYAGLPVSIAEVGTGAVTGAGLRAGWRGVNWDVIRTMGLAWVVTVPASGLIAVAAYLVLRVAHG
jgi:PiT family inorganic phosphate transporter